MQASEGKKWQMQLGLCLAALFREGGGRQGGGRKMMYGRPINDVLIIMTSLFQLNCQRSPVANANLAEVTLGKYSSLWCLQEPYLFKGHHLGLGHLQHYLPDPEACACIVSSQDIDLWLVEEHSSKDVATCIWKPQMSSMAIYLTSVYMDINEAIPDT